MIKYWILASRPLTLSAGLAPVIIGCLYTLKEQSFNGLLASLTLVAALFIQIATNFVNDYADFEKGSDRDDRKGPKRMVQAGYISVKSMKRGAFLLFFLAFLIGLLLVNYAGFIILLIGLISILLGYMYTAGPYPLAYLGLGDVVVLLFFGPIATAGTAFVQTGVWHPDLMLIGLGVGFISSALLAVNNLRDHKEDTTSNKKTIVVRFGFKWGQIEYGMSLIFSWIFLCQTSSLSPLSIAVLVIYALIVLVLLQKIIRIHDNQYAQLLKSTAILLTLYPILYGISIFF
jgi:1,4-dihydroxy-2-naphthoate octaprenyltransferase